MQQVSDKWKHQHTKQLVNESFVEISIDVADPDSIADASAVDNGSVYISDTPDIVSEVGKTIIDHATLEENMWVLDGSRNILSPEAWGDNGYVGSVISNQDGTFDSNPIVTIEFSKVHENIIPGITITWGVAYNEYAEVFKVTAYNGSTEVASTQIIDNTDMKSVVSLDIVNYDRITIEILKWCLPYHRPRISEVFVGINKVYTKKDITAYTHEQEVSPIGATTPTLKIGFSLDNTDGKFDPYNVTGLSKYLMERQEIRVKYGLKLGSSTTEYIPAARVYLSEWDAPQNGLQASFVARDLLEFMNRTYFKGLYNKSGVSLYDLAIDVLTEANLPLNEDGTVKWIIDDSLKSIYTTSPLPLATLGVCLQYITQAARCILYCDRQGILHIEPISHEVSDYALTEFNLYSRPEITLQKPLASVNTKVYNHFVEGDSTNLFSGNVLVNGTEEVVVTYANDAVNVSAAVTNGSLVSAKYYTHACVLTISGNGTVGISVTGNPLTSSTSDYTVSIGTEGEVQEVDNPLISTSEIAKAVSEWVKNYLQNRQLVTVGGWRSDPRLDATDIITSENKYGTEQVRVTNVHYTYNGAFHGTLEGVKEG